MSATVPANVPGIHHVTAITGDVQKCTDFYVGVLGLRFIKKSINQDVRTPTTSTSGTMSAHLARR